MNLGKINLITPPDKLFNQNINYLLIKPSKQTKIQFQQILAEVLEDINVFIFDEKENDIDWMLSVAHQVDLIIIDIDNCDPLTKSFVSFLLSFPNCYYITNDEVTPWNILNKNRIFDLSILVQEVDEDEDHEEKSE